MRNKDLGRVASQPGASSLRSPEPVPVSAHAGDAPSREENPIVGHKTWADGSHTPLRRDEADALWKAAVAEREKRASDMPTEQDAIRALWSAYQRLKELDWNDAIYWPKDGSTFDVIEAGSTGIHTASYEGEWPDGHWWVHSDGDLCPSRPILYRRTEAEKARWAAIGRRLRDRDASLAKGASAAEPRSGGSPGPQGHRQDHVGPEQEEA